MKRLAPKLPTPVPASTGTTSGWSMPDELLVEQVWRLALFGAVGAGLWAFVLFLHAVLLPLTVGRPKDVSSTTFVIEGVGILVSVAMFLYVRYAVHEPQRKSELALGYMVLNAAGIGLANNWAVPPSPDKMMQLSWITILILVTSIIAPAPPKRMLAASLVAASMDPLVIWFAYLGGHAVPSLVATFVLYLPNYICALVAVLPAQVLHRLGGQLREVKELGSYRLVERLGQGGMGEVWRAEHRMLARSAAIKLVRPEVLGAATAEEAKLVLRRFEREARATAALSSPHTIQIFDFGTTDEGNFYYVMELLEGRDLESLVKEFGPVPADRAMFILRQVCHSLADAHARGFVHRDIKPANIYVCRMGLEYDFAKVLDFGLVKVNDRASAATEQTLLTAEHRTTGTPAYMAPELILGEANVDRRADVYALGCVAYHLLTGQLVFEAENPMKMLLHHVQSDPVPPSERAELAIPRELDDLVLACLAKDPDRRPQHAQELFKRACACTQCHTWTQDKARAWWERHLPDLTGPLRLRDHTDEVARTVGVR